MSSDREEKIDRFEKQVWKEFLSKADPKEIHRSVLDSNWDGNEVLMNWIINDPHIDKATALIAYWMSGPRWMKKYKDRADVIAQKKGFQLSGFDFVEALEQKYLAGFWKNSHIACDPANDCEGYDWTSDYLDEKTVREIPARMFEKLDGEDVERPDDLEDGLPIAYYQKIIDFIDQCDLEDDK